MKNRDIFQRDPAIAKLLNDGVASVAEGMSAKEVETLRYELEHFVCEGQYLDGMVRILVVPWGHRLDGPACRMGKRFLRIRQIPSIEDASAPLG